jgi:nitrite reductase (NADH) large subunit
MKKYVIIGNGVAGTTAAENIRKNDREGQISIITDESLPFYYRVRLNEFISGDIDGEGLIVKKEKWYKENRISLLLDTSVTAADPDKKVVFTKDDQAYTYDVLLLAAGSHSFIPPIKGSEKKGVFAIRSIKDAKEIKNWAKDLDDIILIGGGLLGLEAGNALRKLGKNITVVEFFPRLLPRQLDVDGAKRLQAIMEGMNFEFFLGAKTEAVTGDDRVSGVRLEGGDSLDAKMIIISAGVRPNMELAGPLGLKFDKGVQVDEYMRTTQKDVYAAGDVAEFQGIPYGIWPAAMEQGKIAGVNMAGGNMTYQGTTMANTLKVVGIDLASAGDIDAENRFESRVVQDNNVYKKIVIDKGKIIGCIMLGDTTGFTKVTRMMTDKQDVSSKKDKILAA